MAKIYDNGIYREITEKDLLQATNVETTPTDSVIALAEGLSTATTIAQIRAVAKSILNETEGDAV